MKTVFKLILLFTFFITKIHAQSTEIDALVNQGIKLHDNGDYAGAIEVYKKALALDNKSSQVNSELATTYFALKDYAKVIEYSDAVIAADSKFVDLAYVSKGSALDLLGKPKEAIDAYKKAIQISPDKYLPYYNLALTAYNIKAFDDAEDALKHSLQIKPAHGSSHLLLAYVMYAKNSRVKSLLALYNFLLVEPTGDRAKNALQLLNDQLTQNVKREDDKHTSITMNMDSTDEFRSVEVMISLLEAGKNIESNKKKSSAELFADNTKSMFSIMGELNKDKSGFWWDYYVAFFYSMVYAEHNDAFCYYIQQSSNDQKISSWLNDHSKKVDAFLEWYKGHERK